MLDTLTKKDFQEAFQNGGDGGTGVYMWEGTTSRVTVADGPYGEFYDFYSVSPENFGSTHLRLFFVAISKLYSFDISCNK